MSLFGLKVRIYLLRIIWRPRCWIFVPLVSFRLLSTNTIIKIKTFEFSTFYTTIPYSKLRNIIKEVVQPFSIKTKVMAIEFEFLVFNATFSNDLSPLVDDPFDTLAPSVVNYKKGALDSQPQVIKVTSCLSMVGGSLRVLRLLPPLNR
jgi:hypothetical protein